MSFAHWVAEFGVTAHRRRSDLFTVEILAAKKICRVACRECYVAQDVETEWPIPVFCCLLARPLRSALIVPGDCGSTLHDSGQRALVNRPAGREVAD
jgi:hypothetical protein